ncbi:MAG: PLP-dependent transferase [Bacteroidales bacterium]|nr:PLP-dependent transferase [Bacteroidales bacterium]
MSKDINELKKGFSTRIIHTEYPKKDAYNSLQIPVYENVAYEFETAEEMADAFTGVKSLHAYSRISNPTVEGFERRIIEITGAVGVMAVNSGMAAISSTFIELAYSGANIVTSAHLFGNTYGFFKNTLSAFNVEIRFCDLTDAKAVEKCIDENTCALFLEVLTNPHLEVANLKELSQIAHSKGVPLVADTTVIPFVCFLAKDFGVDIEIVSSTKYLSGGGTSLGGLIIDHGTFDWSNSKKLAPLVPQFGNTTFTMKLRKEIHRTLGCYMGSHSANMQSLGLETLEVRYNRSSQSCKILANNLLTVNGIQSVNYTGLPDNRFYEISKSQFGEFPGSMLTFRLVSKEACYTFLNNLKLIKRATNLFDNRSLIIHPASTIYGNYTAEVRRQMEIDDRDIRLSVGLEDPSDLLNDIKQALQNSI